MNKILSIRKRILALVVAMLAVSSAWAFDFSAVSSSGHRLYYTINITSDSNTLNTVKVVAPAYNYYPSWNGYTKPTGNVVVPQTVTYGQNTYTVVGLDNRCFNECDGMRAITLPATIDSIDQYAFYGCGLRSIVIPNSVKHIGNHAFYDCEFLNSVTLPDSLRCIEVSLFANCDSLTSITIPPLMDSIKGSAFNSSGLTSIVVPSSVEYIGSYAFANTRRLTSIQLPASIRHLSEDAFYNSAYYNNSANWVDSTLYISNHLIIMNKVVSGTFTLPAGTIGIADNAIANADNIENISLPTSLKYIGNNAFADAYILSSVNLPSGLERIGDRVFSGCLALENVSFSSSLKHIGEYAFNNCNLLTSVEIPYSLQTIGRGAFETCDNLDTVIWNAPNVKKISDYNTHSFSELFYQCNNFKTLIIGDSIKNISANMFQNITSLCNVVISNNVDSIGNYAFSGCNRLASLDMPLSVSYIGEYSFQNADSLRYVEIPLNVREVGARAFNSCDSLHTVVWNVKKAIMNASNSYGNGVFQNCNAVKLFIIGDSVRYISDYALRYMHSLDTIIIRGELDSIGKYAFNSINGLDYLSFEKGMSSLIRIGEGAFDDCRGFSVDSLVFGNRLVHIGNRAFQGCDSIRYVYIPHTVDTLKFETFESCDNIHTVVWNTNSNNAELYRYSSSSYESSNMFSYVKTFVFGDSVRNIPSKALYGSDSLHTVILGKNVDTIGNRAFSYCHSLRNIDFASATNLTTIGDYAFSSCDSLRNIDLGSASNLTTIGDYVFSSCDSLRNIDLGSATNLTTIGDGALGYYSILRTIGIDLENATNLVSIGSTTFSNCKLLDIDSLRFGNTLKFIGSSAFRGNNSLRYVEIPYSVDTMGKWVFSNCDSLHTVVWNSPRVSIANKFSNIQGSQPNVKTLIFGDSVRYIPDNAFNNSKIETLVLSDNLDSIGYQAFYECDSLRNITFGNSLNNLVKIDEQAFYDCSNLIIDTLRFGNRLKYIGEYAFGYTDVKYLEIPYSLDTIGSTAFSSCDSLTTVIWNSSEARPYNAFYFCDNIETFVFGDSITTIPQNTMVGSSQSTRTTIRKMVFGSSLTSIASDAFSYICNVDTIVCKANVPPTLGNANSLPGYSTTIDVLMVPCESTPAYLANTSWSSHFTDVVADVHISGNADKLAVNNAAYGHVDYDCSTGQMTAVANYGYHFVQWNDGNTQNPRTASLAGDVLYTAIFAKNIYTISFSDTTRGVFAGAGQYEYLDTITISTTPRYGYTFVCWTDGDSNDTRQVVVRQNQAYAASFIPNIYTVNVVSNDTALGTVSGGGSFAYNTTQTITGTPTAFEYCLLRWSDGNTDNPRTITVLGDTTYYAIFGPKPTYTITVTSANPEWGTVAGSGSHMHGTDVTITATANTGYHFTSWSDGNTQNPRTIRLKRDTVFTAIFKRNTYTLTVDVNDSERGWVNGQGSYEYKDTAVLQANSHYGYHFAYWDDDYSNDNPRKVEVIGNMTYTAYFEPNTYNVSLSSTDTNMGTVAGGGSYDYTSEAVIRANSKSGYFFSHWSDGGKSNPRVITIDRDITLTAHFTDTYVSIEEATEKLENLNFKPNPTDGIITFNTDEILKVEVLDAAGRLVAVYENTNVIDLSKINKGYYTLRITTAEGVAIRKVIRK